MKILIINPLWTFKNIIPTNLAEVAAFLVKNKYNVDICDLNFELSPKQKIINNLKNSLKIVKNYHPDLIAITSNAVQLPFAIEFSKLWKKKFPNKKIIFGGIEPTSNPELFLKLSKCDFVIRGEGELSLLNLVKTIEKNKPINNSIKGLSFIKNKKIIHNKNAPLNLKKIPFPAYNLLSKYSKNKKNEKGISISASRGCSFNCCFCSGKSIYKYQRWKKVKRFINEIKYIKKNFGIKNFSINDDVFTINKKWVNKFLNEIKNVDINWECLTRLDTVSLPLLKKMKKNGCKFIYHGVESGNKKVRKKIKKINLSNKKIIDIIKKEIKIGLKPYCSFMMGLPFDTINSYKQTINLASKLKKNGATIQLWIATPYNGSSLTKSFKNKLIFFNRSKKIGQSDIYKNEQHLIFKDYLKKYKMINPDNFIYPLNHDKKYLVEYFNKGVKKLNLKKDFNLIKISKKKTKKYDEEINKHLKCIKCPNLFKIKNEKIIICSGEVFPKIAFKNRIEIYNLFKLIHPEKKYSKCKYDI